ncbi:uncharacterized protein LOC141620702 [Silene latifolia]|uniref:uncharacterized protein LOC141620702 n=1 Tax=Silene latifolia TaxID=37657 RepID=UPI003D771ACF
MGVDANDQLYPLAFAIVEKENTETWSWFLACIRCLVTQRTELCIISDRHPGIMKAMSKESNGWEEPLAYHRFCIRHHASNINTKFKNRALKDLFSWTAFQHQPIKFNKGLAKINEFSVEARAYLDKLPLSKWSMCHGGALRYGIKTTNLAEVFNNVLKGARFLPITALVKVTFYRVNSYFFQRRKFAKSRIFEGLKIFPVVTKYVENNFGKAAHHKVECYNSETGVYQVKTGRGQREAGKGGHTQTVNLSKRTCTNKFQIYHFPCSHVVAVCRTYNLTTDQFIDLFFTFGEYLGSYKPNFHPVPDERHWPNWVGEHVLPNNDLKREKGVLSPKGFAMRWTRDK